MGMAAGPEHLPMAKEDQKGNAAVGSRWRSSCKTQKLHRWFQWKPNTLRGCVLQKKEHRNSPVADFGCSFCGCWEVAVRQHGEAAQ